MAIIADTISDIGRLREIVAIFTRHGFGEFFERINLGRFVPGKAKVEASRDPEASAQRLLQAIQELGPTYIKFGQILSTRPDVLPPAYIKALQTLQDRVQPVGWDAVRQQVENEFGRSVEDLYDRFDPEPLASASIGQVHQAWTRDGRKVAVKVQRPGIDDTIRSDVSLMYTIARMIETFIDLDVGYTPTEIVHDFDKAMQMEVDFTREARNARQFASNFRDKSHVHFPEIIDGLSGRRVLTMGFIDAVKISETYSWPAEQRKLICDRFVEAGVQMILIDGFFHGDPHPGNIFVNEDCEIIFLDVGLAGTLPKFITESMFQLILAASVKDAASAARVVYKLGIADQRVNLADLKQDIQGILDKYFTGEWGNVSAGDLLTDFMDRGSKHGIKHPPELASLAKALMNVEGVVRALYPEIDLLEAIKPHAKQYFSQRMNFENIRPELAKKAYEVVGLLQDLPLQMSQLMMDLEKGRVNVVVSGSDIRNIQAALRSLAITLFLGMVTAALLLGGFAALGGATVGPPGTIVAVIAFALSLVSGFFAFAWHVVAIRLKRPKLTDIIRRKR